MNNKCIWLYGNHTELVNKRLLVGFLFNNVSYSFLYFHFARLPFFFLGEYIIRNFCFVYAKLIYTFFKRFERLFVNLVAALFV